MIHNRLRRLEKDHDMGHWAVARNAMVDDEVLAQVMSSAPDCDQERVSMSIDSAIAMAITLKEVVTGQRKETQNIVVRLGTVEIQSVDGMIHVTMTGGACAIGDSSVTAVMADYDALEFAESLSGQAFDLLVRQRIERKSRFEGTVRPA
jgi:hypothetical protein